MPGQVAVVPLWQPWLENRMFTGGDGIFCSSAFSLWKTKAEELGWKIDTWDLVDPGNVSAVWFLDLPFSRDSYDKTLRHFPSRSKKILQVLESPLIAPASHIRSNHRDFDALVTYNQRLDDVISYRLPVSLNRNAESIDFSHRQTAVLMNTNRYEGWLSTRKNGLVGLPGIGVYFSKWDVRKHHWLSPALGELYSLRRSIVHYFERHHSQHLDLFGRGWDGEPVSWFRMGTTRRYKTLKQRYVEDKLATLSNYKFTLAIENYRGDSGYISEKIFEAMFAGTVPVYLGDESITDVVPQGAFVDMRKFQGTEDLADFLVNCPRDEWHLMAEKGKQYLASAEFEEFSDKRFADRMMSVLDRVEKGL